MASEALERHGLETASGHLHSRPLDVRRAASLVSIPYSSISTFHVILGTYKSCFDVS